MKSWALLLIAVLLSPSACTRPHGRTAYAELPASGDLTEGAPVRFQGFAIGIVQKVTLRRSGVLATLVIQRTDAPLQSNDQVAVHPVGIFGDQAIDIVLASSEGRPLQDGDTLRAAPVAPVNSLSPAREALTRALVHEFTERMFRPGSSKRGSPDPLKP